MKIGRLIIETEKTQSEEVNSRLQQLQQQLSEEIEKIHLERNNSVEGTAPDVMTLNKNITPGVPYSMYLMNQEVARKEITDLDTLKFWAYELPQAPQTLDYINRSVFAHGDGFVLTKGKDENPELLSKIKSFFRKANRNGTSLKQIICTYLTHKNIYGDGYIEKVLTRDKTQLAEVYNIDPGYMVVLKDEDEWKHGKLVILGYAKLDVKKRYKLDTIPDESKLPSDEVIHGKYSDEGDAYGHSPLEKNQELTKFIINVLNLNQKKFTNEIRHSLWVKLGKQATAVDVNVFLAQYRANYLGKYNYGKPLITYGDIDVKMWDMPDKAFDYESFMEKTGKNHAPSLWGIAPSELVNNDAKYSNASQGHVTTILNTIYPIQTEIEDLVNNHIIRGLEGLDMESEEEATYKWSLKRENLYQHMMYQYLQELTTAKDSGSLTINEFRRIVDPINLPDIEEDWANEHFVKLGNTLSDLNQEFFMGTDQEMETKSIEGTDGTKLSGIQSFFDKKK